MVRSPGFGSIIYDLYRPVQTRFPFGFVPYIVLNLAIYNNSPDRSTKSTISHLNVLYLLVNIGFQVLFHSPPGVLFNFPSRYYSTIGHQVVFSLMGWSPHTPGLGSSYFARHYFRNRVFFLFLRLLRCFSSSRSPQYATLLTY